MSTPNSTNIFVDSLKALIKNALILLLIAFAWLMRLIGMIATKIGETTEKIIIKKSSL